MVENELLVPVIKDKRLDDCKHIRVTSIKHIEQSE